MIIYERNDTDHDHCAISGATYHSTAYAISIRFLMFHMKHIERRTQNGEIQTISQIEFWYT
jgi:hypothetical protein